MKWTNPVKQRLSSGGATFGCWLTFPSPHVAEVMANAGYDWALIDMEHSPITVERAAEMAMTFRGRPTVPLARVPFNRPEYFKQALDAGAWGVVTPMVNTAEEAREAVASAHYPPFGMRGRASARNMLSSGVSLAEYYRDSREAILVAAQIETPQALANAEAIAQVPGVDVLFVGPLDLCTTLGVELGSAEFEEAAGGVLDTAERFGKAAGILALDFEEPKRRLEQGFRFVGCMAERTCLQLATQRIVAEMKQAVGGRQ